MIITDTIKLFFNNSGLIWKILLYQLVCSILVCGVAVACCYPLIVGLVDSGVFDQIANIISDSFFNFQINEILSNLGSIMSQFLGIITSNSAQFVPLLILLFIVLGIGGSFIFGLMQIPVMECIYGFMGSFSKLGFGGCFIKDFGRSVRFSLARLAIVLPFDILILAVFLLSLRLFSFGVVLSMLAPFIIVFVLTALISIRISLFSTWASSIVVKNSKIFTGLKDSFKAVSKTYKQMFGTSVAITLIIIVLNVSAIMFTASVGLFLTIPSSVLLCYVFAQVAFFYANGLRFYLDKQTIVTPRKIEDFESLKTLKNIV